MDNIIDIPINMVIKDSNGVILLGKIKATNYTSTNKTGSFTEPTADVDGGNNMGWINPGDYFNYTITVPLAGTYNIGLRISGVKDSQILIKSGSTILNTALIPSTGGWQTWITVYTQVVLKAGTQVLTVFMSKDGFNFNYLTISPYSIPLGAYTIAETTSLVIS
jgi:hypothetical protein